MMNEETLKNGRVIIPYGRSIMALVAAHSLGKKGVEVIGCDSIDFTILSFSNHVKEHFVYPDPEDDEQAFIEAMLEYAEQYKPEDGRPYVLMPIYKDTGIFARHRDKFEPHIKIAAPDYDAMCKLHPKDNFARTVKELDVSAPRTWLPEDEEDLKKLTQEMDFPVIIKPYDMTGGRGIHKAKNEKDLLKLWHDNKKKYEQKSLIQEIYEGKDYCLTGLFDDGELKASMAYRNLHQFPPESGAGIMRETVEDDRFESIARDLMKPLGWNGVAEFDFLWDESGEHDPAMIEVNTRFWGGLFQSVESGIDFPWLLYKLTVTGSIEKAPAAKIGTRTKMPYIWLISAIKDAIDNEEDFAAIEKQGKEALAKLKQGEVLEGLKDYASYLIDYLGETLDFAKKGKRLKKTMELGRSAQNEFLNSEDPYTAFGILFIIGSLIRRGRLPDEVRF